MPVKAATNCTAHGCTGLVRNGICSGCGPKRQDNDRAYDRGRGTAHQRGYGATWQRLRRMQLASEPLCFDCGNSGAKKNGGRVRLATEVHHIIAKRNGGTNSLDNLMSLCKSCHSKRTTRGE